MQGYTNNGEFREPSLEELAEERRIGHVAITRAKVRQRCKALYSNTEMRSMGASADDKVARAAH